MSDAAAILRLYDHARDHALPVVMATVIRTSGSTYRKRGARMMLCADGSRVGVVSGGCLEADVTRRAWYLKEPGAAEVIRYDTGSGEDATYEFGLGCRGVVDIVVERLNTTTPPSIIDALRAAVLDRRSTSFRINTSSIPRFNLDSDPESESYEELIQPPIQLIVFGSGVDVPPLLRMASELGWSIVQVDHKLAETRLIDGLRQVSARPLQWSRGVMIDSRTACLLMTHRMQDDAGYLQDVVKGDCAFIGCLGPLSRTEALIDELALAGVTLTSAERARVRAPVGLDLNAERPQEIALSILAEIAAAMNGGAGGALSAREGPIHKPIPSTVSVSSAGVA